MSWDLFVFKVAGPAPRWEDFTGDEMVPLGPDAKTTREQIAHHLPGVDWTDPTWGDYSGNGFSMELQVGDDDPMMHMMLHVRGGGDPIPAIIAFAAPLGFTVLDCSNGQYIDLEQPSSESWIAFQKYRDKIIGRRPAGQ